MILMKIIIVIIILTGQLSVDGRFLYTIISGGDNFLAGTTNSSATAAANQTSAASSGNTSLYIPDQGIVKITANKEYNIWYG